MTHGLSWAPPGPALSSEDSGGGETPGKSQSIVNWGAS